MIRSLRVRNFKSFKDQDVPISDHVVLAGPNNSGKSTVLQAIVSWRLARDRWLAVKDPQKQGRRGPVKSTGVPLPRRDFSAVPLREMNLLWTDRSTAFSKRESEHPAGSHRPLQIELSINDATGHGKVGFEFRYQSAEQVYVRPIDLLSIPEWARSLNVVHVPPFSGIGAQETRFDEPYQDVLVGQGKAGDILRNLLLEISRSEEHWADLREAIAQIFGFELQPPEYQGLPFIVCDYKTRRRGGQTLDIASGGSGFHQVLLLLSFFYARPASVLLLDEPDAHLHVILQRQIYDRLRQIASERKCQLIVATHSEVVIEATSPERIVSFYGVPHPLISATEQHQVRSALRHLSGMDLVRAENAPGILYTEGMSDCKVLTAFARSASHGALRAINEGFIHLNLGRNPKEARQHFFSLKAIKPNLRGLLLLDGDNRSLPEREVAAEGLTIRRWRRYEIESYLVVPSVLLRYVMKVAPLFVSAAETYLRDALPPGAYRDPLKESDYWDSLAASKSLLPDFFSQIGAPLPKSDYYQISEMMGAGEIHGDVVTMLNDIEGVLGTSG